jgi:tetratricopeptide (TPR) repeat protein
MINYMTRDHAIALCARLLLVVSAFLIPLFFLPVTQEYYDTNKWVILVGSSLLILLLWTLKVLFSGQITVTVSSLTLAFGSLATASVISLLVASTNKAEALLSYYGLSTWISVTILFVAGTTLLDKHARVWLRWALMISCGLLAIFAIYQFFGIGKAMFPTVPFLADSFWTPVGSLAGLVSILALMLPVVIAELTEQIRTKHETGIAVSTIIAIVTVAGLFVTVPTLISKLSSTALPYPIGWAIVLEILKVPKNAFFGVGSENFLSAFSVGRPISINATPLWNLRFTQSSSLVLQIATTLGIIGIAGLAILFHSLLLGVFSKIKDTREYGVKAVIVIGILIFFLLPPSFPAITVFSFLLLTSIHLTGNERIFKLSDGMRIVPTMLSIGLCVVVVASFIWLGKVYSGEIMYYKSLQALQNNKGTDTYYLLHTTIRFNPDVAKYHVALSQTSLALANTLAQSSATASGKPAKDKDKNRKMAADLIQQAIQEAKIAVTKEPTSPLPWENLASIYQSLLRISKGSDQWAVAALQRAIQLDPVNPVSRLTLGGVYVAQQNYDLAAQQYVAAISLKPDYANAHYNLAFIFRQKKQYLNAAVELTRAKVLINPGSPDEKRVASELDEITKLLTKDEKAALAQFTNPSRQPQGNTVTAPDNAQQAPDLSPTNP